MAKKYLFFNVVFVFIYKSSPVQFRAVDILQYAVFWCQSAFYTDRFCNDILNKKKYELTGQLLLVYINDNKISMAFFAGLKALEGVKV